MNRVALRHLCWVLLVFYGVSGSEEETSPRPTTLRIPKPRRPISHNNIGNTIKRVNDDYKPAFSEDPVSSTVPVTSRLSTKRANNEYLARNTVPVAAVTETLRKPYRPAPSHLLTYQALSTTEKGADKVESHITPTGSALASLGPYKNGSTLPFTRRNIVSSGTTKPVSNYWSLRLHRRPPALRPSIVSPADIRVGDSEKREVDAVLLSENLVKNDSSSHVLHDQPGALTPSSTEKENVLEEPSSNPVKSQKLDGSTSPQSSVITTESAPNAKNNLIKGVDLGSKILQGIIAVTNASEYFNEGKDRGTTVNSTEEAMPAQGVSWEPTKAPKPLDGANTVVELVPSVSKRPVKDNSSSEVIAYPSSFSEDLPSVGKDSSPRSHVEEITPNPVQPTALANGTQENVTVSGDNVFGDSISVTVPTDRTTLAITPRTNESHAPEESVSVSSLPPVLTTESRKDIADYEELRVSSSSPTAPWNTTAASVFTSVTAQPTTKAYSPETTITQEVNDIPESEIRDKSKGVPNFFEGTERIVQPVSTIKPLTTTDMKSPRTEPAEETPFTTETPPATTPYTLQNTKLADTSVRITTEMVDDINTSTQNYGETTSRMESDTAATGTQPVVPLDKVSQDESTTRETANIAQTTMTPEIINVTKENSVPALVDSTTVQYRPQIKNNSIKVETVVADEIHLATNKGEDDHDETLKYNITVIDHDKMHNVTEQDTDYDASDKEKDTNLDDEEDEDISTTTTVVVIEEITTQRSTTVTTQGPTSTTSTPLTSHKGPSATTEKVSESTTEKTEEDVVDPVRLRLVFQASYKEMCLVKDSLIESIAAFFRSVTTRPLEPSQVKVLNLGVNECSAKALPLVERVPVILQLTDNHGRGDQNLTDVLYSYIKREQFNFKYPLSSVDVSQKPLVLIEEDPWGGTVIAAIVISSVAGVSLLCLTILLVIMRKRQKGFTYGQRCTPVSLEDYSLDNISVFNSVRRKAMRASKRSYGNPAFDDPVTVSNPLNFVGLSNMANSHAKIDSEYSEVPAVTVKHDELPQGAESKNRYANVIPIPETRVPLNGPEGEDVFINANYVKGTKGVEKFYIACQAPMESTIADFWMMIWEQQSRVILMLTDLHENGVEKCADYLPPSEVLDCHRIFGDLQVTLKKREVREKYVISTLQLKNLESNLFREVIHLWYTAWPIRGVPDDLTSIIAYLIEMRSYSKPGHPIVVHCSPGTGRTGTIIAIDMAIRDFETDRTVDIPKTVYSIRRDRAGAVQTNMQYYLIYQVIHLYATKLSGGSLDSI